VKEKRTVRAIISDITLQEYGQNIPGRFLAILTPEIMHKIALGLISAPFGDPF
jgi:hypothetical protein